MTSRWTVGLGPTSRDVSPHPFAVGNIHGTGSLSWTDRLGGTFRGPRMDVVEQANNISFTFVNYGSDDTTTASYLRVGCSAEIIGPSWAANTFIPLTVAGKTLWDINPGGTVKTDRLAIDLAPGDQVYPRTYVLVFDSTGTNVATIGVPATFQSSGAYNEGGTMSATAPSDLRNTGTVGVLSNFGCYGPVQADGLITSNPRLPVIISEGDSLSVGTGDGEETTIARQFWRGGWIARGINGRVPLVQSSKGGTIAANAQRYPRARSLFTGGDHVIVGRGAADLSSDTVATVQQYFLNIWTRLSTLGPKVWHTTSRSQPTSTDAWATLAGQTVGSYAAKQVTFNAWLRDGAPIDATTKVAVATGTSGALRMRGAGHPLWGVIDLADVLDSARDSGLRRVASGTGTLTTGSNQLTALTEVDALTFQESARIVGTGIPAGTTITARTGTTLTLSANATASGTAVAITAALTNDGTHPNEGGYRLAAHLLDDLSIFALPGLRIPA